MKPEDIEIGHYYSCGDDAIYKVVDKGNDWILFLNYSCNHNVANPWVYKLNDEYLSLLYEETDEYIKDIFDNLRYTDYNGLKSQLLLN